MNKKKLKTGMVVKTRNGRQYRVLLGTSGGDLCIHTGHDGFISLSSFTEDLLYYNTDSSEWDIIAVYNMPSLYMHSLCKVGVCIWMRKPAKEMTVAEIEKALGFKVKVIGGNN